MDKLTAETITDDEIRCLKVEAGEAGDHRQVAVCDLALGYVYATEDADGQVPLDMSQHAARVICADALNDTRAQADAS